MSQDPAALELADYCRERAATYSLFARLIDREVNGEARELVLATVAGLGQKAVPSGPEADVVAGLHEMAKAISRFDRDVENELACDYARIFLAAGTYEGKAAVPYESIYTSEERLLMQDARDQVRAIFRAAKVMPSTGDGSVPEDFAPFELDYMAVLNTRMADALTGAGGEGWDPARLAADQLNFFEAHIANWMGEMLDDVDEVADSAFYHGFARALRGFISCECEDLVELAKLCASYAVSSAA